MQGSKILLVDDKVEINHLISMHLKKEGFEITILEHGLAAIDYVKLNKPDLVILDILLPGIDGFELCRQLRKFTQIPILFVSKKTDESDIILSLEVGGDDFISIPFSPGQFIARVKSNLRRYSLMAPQPPKEEVLIFPGLKIYLTSEIVLLNELEVSLSSKEFSLLAVMALYPDQTFKIDDLYQRIWGSSSLGDTRTLIVHISNLRKKLEFDKRNPKYILTKRGTGYKFNHTLKKITSN